jgi:UDP-2-acetamido-3-amino-2,3-dideoxy-glucuronate N-acetyltransferase
VTTGAPVPAIVHPTAIVEDGVRLGTGTKVWDACHVRGPHTVIGDDCIIGGKTYIAYGVTVGDRCKINSFVYLCTAVTLGNGVFVGAGATFTNDLFPRATTPDLAMLAPSEPDERTLPTIVGDGASIGARATIGCDLTIGRFAMVGMGATVTKDVPPFHLVIGAPAKAMGIVCRCGQPVLRFALGTPAPDRPALHCVCGRRYATKGGVVHELEHGLDAPA